MVYQVLHEKIQFFLAKLQTKLKNHEILPSCLPSEKKWGIEWICVALRVGSDREKECDT